MLDSSGISSKKYDFTNPIVLSDADLSKLKTKSEQFAYYLAGHLSMFLRTEFNLELEDLTADLYSNFTQSIKTPSCVSMFKMQELNEFACSMSTLIFQRPLLIEYLVVVVQLILKNAGLTDIEKALS